MQIIRIPEFSRRVIPCLDFPECRIADYPDSRIFPRKIVWTMAKEGKGDKTVAFSKSDGTAISFKARVTRSKQPTNNYLRHARKSGRMTVSAGAKKPKKTGGNFVRKPPTFMSKKKATPKKGDH